MSEANPAPQSKREKGNEGEDVATEYLTKKGYTIVSRNARIGRTEIDIIAKQDDVLVFVEVKARSSFRFGSPAEAVNEGKAHRIQQALESYMARNNLDCACRCDVISIVFTNGVPDIRHIENAFF